MKITIHRIDYKNPLEKGYNTLPTLTEINQIDDISEIESIGFSFDDIKEMKEFISKFPKYFKLKEKRISTIGDNGYINKPYTLIRFNTFFRDKRMGDINETSIKKRIKFIEKLKEIFNHE